ncbi:MAG: MFS transporter [Erythrobacter sp.]
MTDSAQAAEIREPSDNEIKLVIAASSAGTIFEWYDFFIYGTLAALLSPVFFPSGNETLSLLYVWATFAVGFGFRPIGAILFGYLGDKLGRKYTFLVTVTLMGIATAGVGLVPSAATIGVAAPIIIISFRILQGLALGGEYGGAAIYVAEHAPPDKRGLYTSFIQASVAGGFVLSIAVVLACRALIPADDFAEWGWRVPFLLSIILLGISLWMRLKLSESPVFQAMKEAGEMAGNPFIESFTYPGNKKRIFVALFGVGAGLTVIWYTAFFYSLSFLKGPMRLEDTTAEILIGIGGLLSLGLYILVGKWSDKVGRKKPILWGNIAILFLLFPIFWAIGNVANSGLQESAARAPVTIAGQQCDYDPFADEQATNCGKLLQDMTGLGLSYEVNASDTLAISAGDTAMDLDGYNWEDPSARAEQLSSFLTDNGYDLEDQTPPIGSMIAIIGLLVVLGALSAANYGSVAALLTEMFPAKIRYSSMSIPYHIGAGYFGGFLPLIAAYIVARTGDLYAGLWYTWVFILIATVVAWWGLADGPPKDFSDDG